MKTRTRASIMRIVMALAILIPGIMAYYAIVRVHQSADLLLRHQQALATSLLCLGLLIGIGLMVIVILMIQAFRSFKTGEAASALEAKYQILFESSRDAMMTLAPPSWKFTSSNPAALELFSVSSQAEFVALGPWELSPELQPDGRPSADKAGEMIQTAMREGSHFFQWTHRRLHGESFPATVLLTRMRLAGDTLLQATVRDISVQKQAEEALRETEERFRGVVDNIGVGIAVISPEMRILYLNRQMLDWFPRVDIAATPICYHAYNDPARETPCSYCPTIKTLQDGEVHEDESETPVGGMVRNYRIVSSPIHDETGGIIAAIEMVEDLTERKRAERERQKLAERFQRSDKLAAIGQLAAGVAHEFNNQLAIINGFAELVQRKVASDKNLAPKLERILKAGRRSAELTELLLAYSLTQEVRLEQVDLNATVEDALSVIRGALGPKIETTLDLSPERPVVLADRRQFIDVIMNLCTNARDAMPEGGSVTIRTTTAELGAQDTESFPDAQPGSYACFMLTDTGVGMDAETQRKIFEPFFTTKEVGQGTGLGLSMVYGVVGKCKGVFLVESELNKGTTIKVYLPKIE